MDGTEVLFGMCLGVTSLVHRDGEAVSLVDQCLCIISKHPFLEVHFGVLRDLARDIQLADIYNVQSSDAPDFSLLDETTTGIWDWPMPTQQMCNVYQHSR